MNMHAFELVEHYKAVRARMGLGNRPNVVSLPSPKVRKVKVKKQKQKPRDIIQLDPYYNVISFPANQTPEELFKTYEGETRLPKINEIVSYVSQIYGISRIDLLSGRRTKDLTEPRHVIFYLSRQCSLKSLPEIGLAIGKRDHTTILHGVKKIQKMMRADTAFHLKVNQMQRALTVESLAHRYWGA